VTDDGDLDFSEPACGTARQLAVETPYWGDPAGTWSRGDGSYVETEDRFAADESWQWNHALSSVLGALLDRGLVLESFSEHPYTRYRRWPFLDRRDDGTYWLPAEVPSLPLLYSLTMRTPG